MRASLPLNFRTEILAALTTFATIAHAFVVIPSLLTLVGISYSTGLISTVCITFLGSLLTGLFTGYPFAVAPSLTLVSYTVFFLGLHLEHSWDAIAALVVYTGGALAILNILGVRKALFETLPSCLRLATQAGLGLFIAIIGLYNANILSPNRLSFLMVKAPFGMHHILFFVALTLASLFKIWRWKGGYLLGIIVIWLIALFYEIIPWKGLVALPTLESFSFPPIDWSYPLTYDGSYFLLSLIIVALFDSTASLYALAEGGGYFIDKKKCATIPRLRKLFFCDAATIMVAGILSGGMPGYYLTSLSGIQEGGRSGLVAFIIAFLSILPLFFLPFLSTIPLFATAGILVLIGGAMVSSLAKIDWKFADEWIPALVTFLFIPYSMSIVGGIGVGFLLYVVLKLFSGKYREIHGWTWIWAVLFFLKFSVFPFS